MNENVDIVLRYCGRIGWLGLVMNRETGKEMYRTGAHHTTDLLALDLCKSFVNVSVAVEGLDRKQKEARG